MSFVGLHIHSDYSLLDGASQLPQLIDRALELGMPAIAVTDHGVMYGAIELIKTCRNKNIKPIIGNEMYVVNGDVAIQDSRRKKYHQVVLAKNTQGYKNLVKLTTISHLQGFQGKGIFARPCINKELLEQYHEGLIVTSACLGGEIPQAILQGRYDVARKVAQWYKDVFGEDFYLEIQDHGSPEDRMVNVEIVNISRELNIKIVATNDSHFISCNDVEAHDALLCINTQKLINEEKRMRYSGTEYLKSAEEMAQLFRDHLSDDIIEEAINNTVEVANKVEPYKGILGEPRIPDYPIPSDHTADTYLEEVTWKGLLERMNAKTRSEIKPIYKERLEYELKMMQQMGFSTYFLVVWDYIKFARDNNIPVGPGRGSAAGSLVAYALRITNIDPVHHGLLFERFLNPERKSMPDIDTDFCIERRDEMIKYVTDKYGEDKVAQIITFNRMTSKAVLKDVARVLGISYKKSDQMAKLIPVSRGKPTRLKVMISDQSPAPEFKEAYDHEDVAIHNDAGEEVGTIKVKQWLDMAIRIEGTNKTFGVHAAGVVISKQPLDEIVPLQRNNDGAVITQYYMEDLEAVGLLKMDFLGLKNLTMIQKAVDYIEEKYHHKIDPEKLPSDVERRAQDAYKTHKKLPEDVLKTYKLLEKGDLDGIFQLESSGMMDIVKKLKPSCLDDISSILALYRPGPLDAGLIPQFIDRKHGRDEIRYDHPMLEPILKETYGILCFQEQIMKLAQDLAGYSLGQADILRRCLSGSTQILDAATGNLVSLKEIAQSPEYWLGRKVFSLNLNTQKITQQPITEIHPNGVQDIWQITTKTNHQIKATDDHLFYTVLGWQPLKAFKIGDRVGLAKTLPITNQSKISDAQIKLVAYLIGDGHLSTKSPVQKTPSRSLSRHRVENFAIAFQNDQLKAIAESDVFWDEIVRIDYIGKEEVFDLSIPETHNFIANNFIAHNCMGKKKAEEMQKQRELFIDGATKNGVQQKLAEKLFEQMVQFAEYCFNKSHSMAYAYVTYETAYLKANYPVEYMAALLSANSGDTDKIQKYIESCQKSLGIKVIAPDLNLSGMDFTPSDNSIIFGLSAIKNVGEGAIEHLLAERRAGGEFKSYPDLCDRINLQVVNSRALESLIKCGALDKLNPNRRQAIDHLDKLISWAQSKAKDRAVGQQSIFDLLGGGTNTINTHEDAPKPAKIEDFTVQEKLQFEKELLGFYVSEHPLKSILESIILEERVTLEELTGKKSKVKVVVVITSIKLHTTKKGDRMAFLQIEDLTGQMEAIVFPRTYQEIKTFPGENDVVLITGKLDKQEDKTQLIIDELQFANTLPRREKLPTPLLEDLEVEESEFMVLLHLKLEEIYDLTRLQKLHALLKEQSSGNQQQANIPIVATVKGEFQHNYKGVCLGRDFWIQNAEATLNSLKSAGFDAEIQPKIEPTLSSIF